MPFAKPHLLLILGALLVAGGAAIWEAGLDLPLHHALRLAADGPWVRPVVLLSATGGLAGQAAATLIGVALLLRRRRPHEAIWLFATVASGRLLAEGIKLLAVRPRPPIAERLEPVTSWSFPSAHSTGSMLACLCLAILFGRRWPVPMAALAFVGLIGWSRLALGVHWPSDVLCGWGIAMAWVGLALVFPSQGRRPCPVDN